jgi:AcrR family transcriptional regulator
MGAHTMPRPKLRTPELADHVLRSALDLLTEDGVAGFSTRRVADRAGTSTPAVYELFGDRAGLVRQIFAEGFRRLAARLEEVPQTDDPVKDLILLAAAFRSFLQENPVLADVMFSRPFADFDPEPNAVADARRLRRAMIRRVQRCTGGRLDARDTADAAHALMALCQGLAMDERAGILGRSNADRRWDFALRVFLRGLVSSG